MSSAMFDLSTENIPEEGLPLSVLLHDNGFKPEFVMVRLDGEVIKKQDMAATLVKRTSRVRVYRLVGGG